MKSQEYARTNTYTSYQTLIIYMNTQTAFAENFLQMVIAKKFIRITNLQVTKWEKFLLILSSRFTSVLMSETLKIDELQWNDELNLNDDCSKWSSLNKLQYDYFWRNDCLFCPTERLAFCAKNWTGQFQNVLINN